LALILYANFGSLKTKQGNSYLVSIRLDVSLLKMVIKRALLIIIFLFGSGLAQSNTTASCIRSPAKATVEIQDDGQVGFGTILMSNPTSCASLITSDPIETLSRSVTATSTITSTTTTRISSTSTAWLVSSPSKTPTWISLISVTPFNLPLSFGGSRTQMINTTSTSQHLFPTGSSQLAVGAQTSQNLSKSNISTPQTSLVAGSSTRSNAAWSHVFLWAAVTELLIGFF
jgi:hypothetical protein